MTKVIDFEPHLKAKQEEEKFVVLLETEAENAELIRPLSASIVSRIEAIKERARSKREMHELIEC